MTTHVERVLYSDRTLLRSENPDTSDYDDGWADLAYDAIRAMNHITSRTNGEGIPAPVVYDVLGNLAGVAGMLPQLLEQLSDGLKTSLGHFDVYDRKGAPEQSVAVARDHLSVALAAAKTMAGALSAAQVAINSQGYHAAASEEQ